MKNIHQIWVGKNHMPARLKAYCKTVEKAFPEFNYIFWDEEKVSKETWVNEEICKGLIPCNIGLRSDILRMEVLKKFGGIYIDTDFECLKPCSELFLPLMSDNTFGYADEMSGRPANGMMFSSKNHPILNFFIEKCKFHLKYENLNNPKAVVKSTGPEALAKILNCWCGNWSIDQKALVGDLQVGNYYNSKSVCAIWKEFVYPYNYHEKTWANFDPKDYPLAYMAHHWEGSWNR
jgi:mannosyltransferase OCH1-like enzyme